MLSAVFTSLLLLCLWMKLSQMGRLHFPVRLLGLIVGAVLLMVTVKGLSLFGYVRGVLGDLSVATGMISLFTLHWIIIGEKRFYPPHFHHLLWCVVILGCLLYPFALGVGPIDPYRWGYHSSLMIGICFVVAVIALLKEHYMILWWVLLGNVFYFFGWLESDNLWDYLIDPVAWLYAMGYLIVRAVTQNVFSAEKTPN